MKTKTHRIVNLVRKATSSGSNVVNFHTCRSKCLELIYSKTLLLFSKSYNLNYLLKLLIYRAFLKHENLNSCLLSFAECDENDFLCDETRCLDNSLKCNGE